MITSIDKALAALLGAIVYFLGLYDITLPWLTAEMQQQIAVALTPIVVWAVPNKKPAG